MIRGFRAISRAVATVAISAGLVVAATTGASAMTATDGDLPAATSITAAADPVPDVAAEEVTGAVEAPVADVVPPLPLPVPELPAAGLLDGLLSAITNLIGSLLGGLPLPLPVPGV
jgi:hypothetical protein